MTANGRFPVSHLLPDALKGSGSSLITFKHLAETFSLPTNTQYNCIDLSYVNVLRYYCM